MKPIEPPLTNSQSLKPGMVVVLNAVPQSGLLLKSVGMKNPNYRYCMAVIRGKPEAEPRAVIIANNPNHPTDGWKAYSV